MDATSTPANAGRATICGGGGTTDEDAYFANHAVEGISATQTLAIYDATSASNFRTNAQTLNINTWYWTRIENTGTTIRYRTWEDGAGEPGTWDVSVTDATHAAAGSGRAGSRVLPSLTVGETQLSLYGAIVDSRFWRRCLQIAEKSHTPIVPKGIGAD